MELTSAEILVERQRLNCCCVGKTSYYIEQLKCGQKCDKSYNDAKLMRNLLSCLEYYIPIGDIVSGTHAYATVELKLTPTGNNGSITIQIDSVLLYTITCTNLTESEVYELIATTINDLNPQTYQYQSISNGDSVTISSTDYEVSNGVPIRTTTTIGGGETVDGTLDNGVAVVYRLEADNCLTNLEAENILNKIKSLCPTVC